MRGGAHIVIAAALLAGAPAAHALDPAVESKNYSKGKERQAIYQTPEYQAKLRATGARNAAAAHTAAATDPERNFSGHLCSTYEDGCAGDVRLYDWGPEGYGVVQPVLFTARNGATLSGRVWATKSGPAKRPGIVITNGSVQAPETLYWFAAQTLAKAGYVVLTFDPQGQGQSDENGESPDEDEGSPAQTDGRPFFDGTVDALNFFFSTRQKAYKPVPSCETGTSHAAKHDRRVKEGLNAAFNPYWELLDRSRVGLAGHSYGAAGISYVGQWDARVKAIVAWDNLALPDPNEPTGASGGRPRAQPCPSNPDARRVPKITKPGLGMSADYFIPPEPNTSDPDPPAKSETSRAYSKAGVDTGEIVIRGGTHYEFSWIPNPGFTATLRGADMVAWYTQAWFDRYVKGDRSAESRLLTNRWHSDRAEAAVDPDGDGNMFSFYYPSRLDIGRDGGRRFRSEDLRSGKGLAADCEPVPFDYVDVVTSPDRPRSSRACPVALPSSGPRCLPRRLKAGAGRIGPARLGRSYRAFFRRYRAVRHDRGATRFCVSGGGRFLVGARRGRIDFVASTARGHRNRRLAPGRRVPRAGFYRVRRIRRGVFAGHRRGRGRIVYRVRRGRVRFVAAVSRRQAARPRSLVRRLRGLRL